MVGGNYLEDEDRKELESLYSELNRIEEVDENNITIVNDKKLKRRIAKFFLNLVEGAGEDKELIREISYDIAGFMQFKFDETLDAITGMAGELELPEEHVSGDVIEMFKDMKKKLKKYLS